MLKTQHPTTAQVHKVFLLTAMLTLVSSTLLIPRIGLGTNLWVNEYIYLLLPPLLVAKVQGWSLEETYRLKASGPRSRLVAVLAGLSLWPFASYVSRLSELFLARNVGNLPSGAAVGSSVSSPYQAVLLALGMLVLAPICEEIFFRGFVQAAYERYNPDYGYVITGVLFGAYHVLNGVTQVIPATILGLGMGYLAKVTGSLGPSMLFHAAANFSALFWPSFFLPGNQVPVWLHLAAPAGLIVAFLLLGSLKGQPVQSQAFGQEGSEPSLGGVPLLVITILFFVIMAVFELLSRLNILPS